MNVELFINQIGLRSNVDSKKFNDFPLNINALKSFDLLKIQSPVLIFNGENGCGKSTIIEAIATILNLPIVGGNQNMSAFVDTNLKLRKENSLLAKYLYVNRSAIKPYKSYFIRAESFHELASLIDDDSTKSEVESYLNKANYSNMDLLKQSHGESFMDLIEHQFTGKSLYLLDEPESALSPQNQLRLLCIIDNLIKEGSQFIIATHSPFLLGYRNATIINLDNGMHEIKFEDTKIYNLYKRFMDDYKNYQHILFDTKN